ncbi:conserved hypothetical protein [Vibrio crassostreae]|uniref:Uncharacterized protein n=2 Tax=Vibrio TaxID=662 RepID=A0A822MWT3_9VIBR|nr:MULTISPECIES: hypothetical protein [Vibrio]MDH5924039.1 hypothetical protein [Vibrio splendidus]MDH5939395.1 hypothetical protein [Vibrio splendidus]MDH5953091.1 hypothetical protein [Vibrio crassostreae]TCL15396.1 hypothetical protein EDB52_1374 [Vibrio crassostreae]TCN00549.1 hypothetical protein EDB35_14123 [Vibrio crassostreae]
MTRLLSNTAGSTLRKQLKMMRQSEGAVNTPTLSSRRLAMTQRLNYLKMFSRGQSPEQLGDVDDLKGLKVREAIKVQFPDIGQQAFQRHDIYELLLELSNVVELGQWRLHESAKEMVVYASYGSVYPGLRFQKRGEAFHCIGFNFDIRLA